jgi:hypothetical protein
MGKAKKLGGVAEAADAELTPEEKERAASRERREKRNAYMREWTRRKAEADPCFKERERIRQKEYHQRMAKDTVYREKRNAYMRERRRQRREVDAEFRSRINARKREQYAGLPDEQKRLMREQRNARLREKYAKDSVYRAHLLERLNASARQRRAIDPVYRARLREENNKRLHVRYYTDAEFREKAIKRSRERYSEHHRNLFSAELQSFKERLQAYADRIEDAGHQG